LFLACQEGYLETVEALVARGAVLITSEGQFVKDEKGNSILDKAKNEEIRNFLETQRQVIGDIQLNN
jgi:hypothetical protein